MFLFYQCGVSVPFSPVALAPLVLVQTAELAPDESAALDAGQEPVALADGLHVLGERRVRAGFPVELGDELPALDLERA